MTKISDLHRDLTGEILSRVTLTSTQLVRSTCKTWNEWSKKELILGEKARKDQFLEFMVVDHRVCLLRFDLRGIRNDDNRTADSSMKKLIIPNHQVKISRVFHCDGLLLCVLKDDLTKLLVWNPYLGQSRLIIQPGVREYALYALGYDNNRHHKILKFFNNYNDTQVYDLRSDSWRVIDNLDNYRLLYHTGVSLKGNTYFSGGGSKEMANFKYYLVCFDFTTERFGPCLYLPKPGSMSLFWVRDEKLAVAVSLKDTLEIWITTKIEPNAISWSIFLRVNMSLIDGLPYEFLTYPRNFFIDVERFIRYHY